MEEICYKRNFLTEVIARVDFLSPVELIEKQLPPEVSREVRRHFPIAEPEKMIGRFLRIGPRELAARDTEGMAWHFHGKERAKTLTITPHAMFARYTAYQTYEILKAEFSDALSVFLDTFRDAEGSRLGLRYINNITVDDGDPLEWGGYLNPEMLHLFRFYQGDAAVIRVFHNLEFKFDEFSLRYQFGMHNPDYPAPIRRKVFVLDLDAYYEGVQERDEIPINLDRFHDRIQALFELSITDRLREIMNA